MLSLPDGGGDIQDKSLEEIEKEFNPKTLAKINVDAVPIEDNQACIMGNIYGMREKIVKLCPSYAWSKSKGPVPGNIINIDELPAAIEILEEYGAGRSPSSTAWTTLYYPLDDDKDELPLDATEPEPRLLPDVGNAEALNVATASNAGEASCSGRVI